MVYYEYNNVKELRKIAQQIIEDNIDTNLTHGPLIPLEGRHRWVRMASQPEALITYDISYNYIIRALMVRLAEQIPYKKDIGVSKYLYLYTFNKVATNYATLVSSSVNKRL
jgi:hypothetical protein